MEEVVARAELVALPDASASNAVTLAIPRRDIETALAAEDGPMDLVLDVTRTSDAGEQSAELRKIAISWEPDQLEHLLQRADGEVVTVVFDGEGLARLVDPDFELHGLREGLAVIAAAVVAGAAAGVATGAPLDEGAAGPSAGAAYTAVEQTRAVTPAAPVDIESLRSTTGANVAPAAASIEAVRSAEPIPVTSEAISSAAGIEAVRSAAATPAISAAEGIEAMRSAEATPAPSIADDGIAISMPGPETIALFGGLALLITGAAFVSRARRPVRPA